MHEIIKKGCKQAFCLQPFVAHYGDNEEILYSIRSPLNMLSTAKPLSGFVHVPLWRVYI